jgi:hypothetical protein
MKVVMCVATMTQNRAIEFMEGARKVYGDFLVVVVGTGEDLMNLTFTMRHETTTATCVQLENKPRQYAEVMLEKFRAVTPHCDDDTIVIMIDDDYSVNPFAIEFIDKIFSENPRVDYMSVLRGSGLIEANIEMLSGLPFMRCHSMMGGSMIVRWSTFKSHAQTFFDQHGIWSMFDVPYWSHLGKHYGINDVVYTLMGPCSLMQHCNLGSNYRGKEEGHAYGEFYDSRINIMEWVK